MSPSEALAIGAAVTVRISGGKIALIDTADEERVNSRVWTASWSGWRWYAVSRRGGKTIHLHRFIMNAPEGVQIDHENLDGLDCRRENLRVATQSQNNANRAKKTKAASSRFKGVDAHHGKWRARIKKDGVQSYLGHFSTPEAAAAAYNVRAAELFGAFARLNEIPERAA